MDLPLLDDLKIKVIFLTKSVEGGLCQCKGSSSEMQFEKTNPATSGTSDVLHSASGQSRMHQG